MLSKAIPAGLALALLTGCMSAETYKTGTRNGEDIYEFDAMGTFAQPHASHLKQWASQMCPQGYRVVETKLDPVSRAPGLGTYWWDVTIACPAK